MNMRLFREMSRTIERQAKELEALRPRALEAASIMLELVNNPYNRPTALAQQIRRVVELGGEPEGG